ncbi:glycosyltransferase BC10-like [Impatiens glandulifera]|uniref:glycosyltransferase BC10-like n=1 Tax=Impatiens glandulifera TaxID=253017 RepID=UPI001FB19925|nr:glycosyltransferase BC10-like [Impatiens glandulifera]
MFPSPFVLLFALLLSLPLVFLFAPRILPLSTQHPQISIADELDDLDLFSRAAAPRRHSHGSVSRLGPTDHKPKIAFLFLTNTDLHFAPLWEKFFKGNKRFYNVYVHAYPSAAVSSPGGVFQDRFIAAKKTERSSPTLISSARRLLATAILDDPLNSYFALVSQHCIPLHSFRFMYRTLFTESTQSHPTSYIEILAEEPQLWDRYTARGDNVMLPEVTFENFRVGSQFYILARRHALLVIKDRKLWVKFRLPCLNVDSCYPEEHYFPTLLSMADPNGCSHYTLTRVNWTESTDGHPHTYYPPEVSPGLIRKLRVSNSTYSYFFARKFSPDCLQPLLKMSEKVIFRD